jgi:hypothetical protein
MVQPQALDRRDVDADDPGAHRRAMLRPGSAV